MTLHDTRSLPRASYRLQLNKDFTFQDAERIAPYLGKLGVSHAYLSPVLKARAGSTHGYDTVDHTLINPELGSLDDFRRMAGALRQQGVGIILDIVPNHMGIGGADNPYWLDLLEWGRDSRYADWFDVNWSPTEPSLHNKVLAPFLGCSFAEAVQSGRLSLRFDAKNGTFAAWAEDTHKLPIYPRHYGDILAGGDEALQKLGGDFSALTGPGGADHLQAALSRHLEVHRLVDAINGDRQKLELLFQRQNWRAARYSVAADDINYRRFFIVSDLGAIRVEREDVFDHAHRLVFQLVEEGLVDGLRVDHIDGLYDPKQYALRLREKCPRPIYLVVEKILAPGEQLPDTWQVDGTTGYEFANAAIGLLVDPTAEDELTQTYQKFTGRTQMLDMIERDAKLEIIDYEMAAELDALTTRLCKIAASSSTSADLTRNGLRNGLRHFVASMAVYRSYVDGSATEEDRQNISSALADARLVAPTLDSALFDFIGTVATGDLTSNPRFDGAEILETAMRLQQFTGPAMAKGLEDTALYRFNRLLALSDVGQRPDLFGLSVPEFHAFNSTRADLAPIGMLTSSSHDTKRGEDVRARIAALSQIPGDWAKAVFAWRDLLRETAAPEIDDNDLYYFFQQCVGSWPVELLGDHEVDTSALKTFEDRSIAAMTKAVREAREHTTWTAPDADYETALAKVVEAVLEPTGPLFAVVRKFASTLAARGARGSIIATALKLTVPGMPDIYQGAELHELSMVDPDNRRPVDFAVRERLLAESGPIDLVKGWSSGAAKLGVIKRLLELRTELPELFSAGSYEALDIEGDRSGHAVAFLRRNGKDAVLVCAWLGDHSAAGAERLRLPAELITTGWRSVLGETSVANVSDVGALLEHLPVAVLRNVNA